MTHNISIFYERQEPHEVQTAYSAEHAEELLRSAGWQKCLESWNKGLWTKLDSTRSGWLYARVEEYKPSGSPSPEEALLRR